MAPEKRKGKEALRKGKGREKGKGEGKESFGKKGKERENRESHGSFMWQLVAPAKRFTESATRTFAMYIKGATASRWSLGEGRAWERCEL